MEHRPLRHEKVRFRRNEIARLEALPSAVGQDEHWQARRPIGHRLLLWAAFVATGMASLAAVVVAGVYAISVWGIGNDRIRIEAERAIEAAIGIDVDAALGGIRLSVDPSKLLVLAVDDVSVKTAADGAALLDADALTFDVRLLPLISGRLELGGIKVAGAHLAAPAPQAGERDLFASLEDEHGLVDPDKAAAAVFGAVHELLDAVDRGAPSVELSDIEIGFSGQSIVIKQAAFSPDGAGVGIAASIFAGGREANVTGKAARNASSHRISELQLSVSAAAPSDAVAVSDTEKVPEQRDRIGAFEIAINGAEGIGGDASRLALAAKVDDFAFSIDKDHFMAGSGSLAATVETGTGKLEIERLRLLSGRSQFEFHGAVGPKPSSDRDTTPSYRYELISDGSTVSPDRSPEPALPIYARVAGWYEVAARKFIIEQFGVRTRGGELLGTANVEFVDDGAPGIFLAATIPSMPVSHVKQLWPFAAAAGARRWAMANMFGGVVTDSSIQYHVAPRRLGNGVPLSHEEVSGRFKVDGTRFDIAGRLPPVRDASGVIEFAGNDVDVTLSSGTAYMPSGRWVSAANGKLAIHGANKSPLVGKLDIDVKGSADAVTELASYEPIRATQRTGMAAGDFSGSVEGNVKADIPLIGDFKGRELPFLVSLDFEGLALGPPVEGQKVTEADGTIIVDPDKAVIKAKAKLNGATSELDIVEPFGEGAKGRKRDIQMVLDDKARATLVSGLGDMLSGPVKVKFDASNKDDQSIEADLTDAVVSIPWAGWSKGKGIAATVKFDLDNDGDTTRLSNFDLNGKSFGVKGDVTLVRGALTSATFDSVRLNRGDDVSVTIKAAGKGYAVDVRGAAVDARSIIKTYLSDEAVSGTSSNSKSPPVSVNLVVDRLTGFHDETLSGAKLEVSVAGGALRSMVASAASDQGGAIAVRNGAEGNRRFLEMQSADAGSILRFLDIYRHMEGGTIRLAMSGPSTGSMKGQVDATNFTLVNEPKLASMVSKPLPGDSRTLNEAVRGDMDTSRVRFERGFAALEKRSGYLALDRGVLRGPLIGTTFQGTLYDEQGNMDMTGTFMPAYGLNRIFGEIPLVGLILGNGRDRGLIGVTYRLSGKAAEPKLQINPLSVIAPGIFRSIFEFR